MKGGQDDVGPERQPRELGLQRARHRLDIDRIVEIGRHDPQRRLPAHLHEDPKDLVARGRGRRRAVLRIERHQQDALAALGRHRVEPRGDRRIAVAHRPVDDDMPAERLQNGGKLLRLRPRDGLERRLVLFAVPDLVVVAAFAARPKPQDVAVEHQLPQQAVLLDHPLVGQKLAQIPPHRGGVGRVGRSQIGQEHADSASRDRGMIGRTMGRGGGGLG